MDEVSLNEVIALMRKVGTDFQHYEVKAASQELPKSLPETISAFSNGSGGTVILGLSEAEGFTPVKGFDPSRAQDALSEMCADRMSPPVRPNIDIVEFEGAPILVAYVPEIHPKDKPCYVATKGKYQGSFIRTGDGDHKLSGYEVDRLLEEHRQPRYDIEIAEGSTMEDLDPIMVEGLLRREREKHGAIFGKLEDEEALQNLGAIRRDDDGTMRPTIAGILALGIYPQRLYPRLCVTFAAFPGTTKAQVFESGHRLLDSETLVGSIPAMIKDAVAVVQKNMRTGAVIEGAFRRDLPDYPTVAIREAVANALMHRDYSPESLGTPVQINMFADRIEITNPGGLYGTVTIDQLGKAGTSSTRNQHLAVLLESTPYPDGGWVVENRGTGYQEITARLLEAKMAAPIPKDTISFFSLTFTKRRLLPEEQRATSTPDVRAAILGMLEKEASVSAREMMNASGLSRAGIMRHIHRLLDDGIIEPTEPGRSPRQRYRLAR